MYVKPTARLTALVLVALFVTTSACAKNSYADSIYRDFAYFANDKVVISVLQQGEGALSAISEAKVGSVIGRPEYEVTIEERPVTLENPRFREINASEFYWDDLDLVISEFGQVGLPTKLGRYQILTITVSIGDDVRSHRALELCWNELSHCVVIDNSIPFLDSIVQGIRKTKAQGPSRQIIYRNSQEIDKNVKALRCRVSGSQGDEAIDRQNAVDRRRTNALGLLMYKYFIPSAYVAAVCRVNPRTLTCEPDPEGQVSIARNTLGQGGWQVKCDKVNPTAAFSNNNRTINVAGESACAAKRGNLEFEVRAFSFGGRVNIVRDSNGASEIRGVDPNLLVTCITDD